MKISRSTVFSISIVRWYQLLSGTWTSPSHPDSLIAQVRSCSEGYGLAPTGILWVWSSLCLHYTWVYRFWGNNVICKNMRSKPWRKHWWLQVGGGGTLHCTYRFLLYLNELHVLQHMHNGSLLTNQLLWYRIFVLLGAHSLLSAYCFVCLNVHC